MLYITEPNRARNRAFTRASRNRANNLTKVWYGNAGNTIIEGVVYHVRTYLTSGRSTERFSTVTIYALATPSEWKAHQAGYCSIQTTQSESLLSTVDHHVAFTVFVPFLLLD